jgi:meso-butanediol dehydrogenase / (S,S)-butanediol dehydrogenase / diacetyl reductase
MSNGEFFGKVVVVTGGASGMGAACARKFAAAGATVLIVDRNASLAAVVALEIGSGVPLVGDISDSEFCSSVAREAVNRYGSLDVLVNAAGVIVRARGEDTTDEQWHHIMGINVSGTFFMCRSAIAEMKKRGGGAIVNFGSIWGDLGSSGVAAYCASKGAVHNLTRALAMDHAHDNVRVNAVCPGEVNTPMLASERTSPVTEEMMAAIAESVPMGRLAHPDEIANVVVFLASPAASYMTGSLISVDAGYSAR